MGENYGHVIFEALSVGCIPIISDQTPWGEIQENHAGFIYSLNKVDDFSRAIDKVAKMNPEDREKMAKNAVQIAKDKMNKNCRETGYRKIFG